ncbi:hypothetical protein [Adlercreutzia equolifaciens]
MERVDCGIPHRVSVNAWSDCAICYPGESFEVQVNAKCLNGCSLEGKSVVLLNDAGCAAARAVLGKPDAPGGLCPATMTADAPSDPGRHTFDVVTDPDESHLPGQRLIRLTVLPKPDRTAVFEMIDETTGKAIPDATLFFFDLSIGKGRPLTVDTDEAGKAEVRLCSESRYSVRAECESYNEAIASIEVGSEPVEQTITMLSTDYNKQVIGGPGYDPY